MRFQGPTQPSRCSSSSPKARVQEAVVCSFLSVPSYSSNGRHGELDHEEAMKARIKFQRPGVAVAWPTDGSDVKP